MWISLIITSESSVVVTVDRDGCPSLSLHNKQVTCPGCSPAHSAESGGSGDRRRSWWKLNVKMKTQQSRKYFIFKSKVTLNRSLHTVTPPCLVYAISSALSPALYLLVCPGGSGRGGSNDYNKIMMWHLFLLLCHLIRWLRAEGWKQVPNRSISKYFLRHPQAHQCVVLQRPL